MLSQIFRFAVRNLRADNDPAHAVKGTVMVPDTKHHPTLKLKDLPAFLQKMTAYLGRITPAVLARNAIPHPAP